MFNQRFPVSFRLFLAELDHIPHFSLGAVHKLRTAIFGLFFTPPPLVTRFPHLTHAIRKDCHTTDDPPLSSALRNL